MTDVFKVAIEINHDHAWQFVMDPVYAGNIAAAGSVASVALRDMLGTGHTLTRLQVWRKYREQVNDES